MALFAPRFVGQSQPPSPTPTKASQEQKDGTSKAAQDAKAAQSEPKNSPLSVTIDSPVTVQKSAQERQNEAREIKHKASNERWLIIWTAVLAGTTFLLAVITAFLARFTYKLWYDASKASERQSEGMRESLSIADQTAKATTIAAEAASRQAKAAVNVERPFVLASDIELVRVQHPKLDQQPIEYYRIVVTYTNYGRTPAIVLRFGHGDALGTPPPEPVYRFDDISGLVIKPGESHPFRPLNLFTIKPDERKAITQVGSGSDVFPWVWGQIRYRDFFNGITEIGFAAFQYPAVLVGGKILERTAFRLGGPPAYTYQKYTEDKSAPEAG